MKTLWFCGLVALVACQSPVAPPPPRFANGCVFTDTVRFRDNSGALVATFTMAQAARCDSLATAHPTRVRPL